MDLDACLLKDQSSSGRSRADLDRRLGLVSYSCVSFSCARNRGLAAVWWAGLALVMSGLDERRAALGLEPEAMNRARLLAAEGLTGEHQDDAAGGGG